MGALIHVLPIWLLSFSLPAIGSVDPDHKRGRAAEKQEAAEEQEKDLVQRVSGPLRLLPGLRRVRLRRALESEATRTVPAVRPRIRTLDPPGYDGCS